MSPKERNRIVINVVALAVLAATLALPGAVQAIVGGDDAALGEFPEVAEVVLGQAFLCTGTLIDSTHVLSAGHCGSLTGAAVSSPISWPPALIEVRIGSNKPGQGELAPVKSVSIPSEYFGLTKRNDLSVIELQKASTKAPTKVAGAGERASWEPGDLETIVGWGVTREDGDLPDTLQKAKVPITTDSYCAKAYSDFDPNTMVCAGYPNGGTDTCQGDSGGPMFGQAADGSRRVVGVTSWGEGCARKGKPGVYARVADTKLREWVRSVAPDGVSGGDSAPPVPGTIAGKVTETKTKAALTSASVNCGSAGSATTGADGAYSIAGVAAGSQTCTASKTGYQSKTQTFNVPSGGTATVNFALRASTSGGGGGNGRGNGK